MIEYLQRYFRADTYDEDFSLAILAGRGGARLTHSHSRQYHYVLQSLTLWREILHDFFKLWYLAGKSPYFVSVPCLSLCDRNPVSACVCVLSFLRVQEIPLCAPKSEILHDFFKLWYLAGIVPSPNLCFVSLPPSLQFFPVFLSIQYCVLHSLAHTRFV